MPNLSQKIYQEWYLPILKKTRSKSFNKLKDNLNVYQ